MAMLLWARMEFGSANVPNIFLEMFAKHVRIYETKYNVRPLNLRLGLSYDYFNKCGLKPSSFCIGITQLTICFFRIYLLGSYVYYYHSKMYKYLPK